MIQVGLEGRNPMGDYAFVRLAALFHDPVIKALILGRGVKHHKISRCAYRSLSGYVPYKHLYLADVISSYLDRTLYSKIRIPWSHERNVIVKHPISCRSLSVCTLRESSVGGESALRNIIEIMTYKLANSDTYKRQGGGIRRFFERAFAHSLRCMMFPSADYSGGDEGTKIIRLLRALIAKPGLEEEFSLLVWRWMHLIYYSAFLQAASPSSQAYCWQEETSGSNLQGNRILMEVLKKNKQEILFILDKVLPADTRSPYNPITDHLESTAALLAVLEIEEREDNREDNSDEKNAEEGLASLHFSLRGIDEFLAESRTTADFWASSFIVSYLTWSSMKRLFDGEGGIYFPANVVYPAQRGSPWMDMYIMKRISEGIKSSDELKVYRDLVEEEEGYYDLLSGILRPALPGIFLAWISSKNDSLAAKEVFEGFEDGLKALNALLSEFSNNVGLKWTSGDDWLSLFALRPNIYTIKWYGINKRELDEIKNLLIMLSNAYPYTPADWYRKFQETWKKYSYSWSKGRNKRVDRGFKNLKEVHYAHIHQLGRSILREFGNPSYEVQRGNKCTVCGWRQAIVEWSPSTGSRYLEEYLRPRERLCPVCLIKRILAKGLSNKNRELAIAKLLEKADLYLDEDWKKSLGDLVGRFPSTDDIASSPYSYLVEKLTGRRIDEELKEDALKYKEELSNLLRYLRSLYRGDGIANEQACRKYLDDLITFIHYVRNVFFEGRRWMVGSLLYDDVYNRVDRALSELTSACLISKTGHTEADWEYLKKSLRDLKDNLQRKVRIIRDEAVKKAAEKSSYLAEALDAGPSSYYSVLIANVDGVNLYVIGRIGPAVMERIHPNIVRELLEEEGIEEFLKSRAPITPTGHKALSRLLTNFLLFVAPDIIERYPDREGCLDRAEDGRTRGPIMGKVVLAGGDQVYALLPGSESPFVAVELEEEFAKPLIDRGGRYFYGSDGTITLSSALVIAHRFFPVGEAFRRAKELLRKTKELRRIHTPMWPRRSLSHCSGERAEGWIGMELVTRSYNTRRAILPASALRATLDMVGLVSGRGPCYHYCSSNPALSRSFVRDVQMVSKFSDDWNLVRRIARFWVHRNLLEDGLSESVERALDRILDILQDYGNVAEHRGSTYSPLNEFLQALLIIDKVTGS